MYTQIKSLSCEGLQVHPIEIEVSTGKGLPGTVIVGLPGKAIMESRDRVKMAIQNSAMPFPRAKTTINLAPGDLKKEGPLYDLPIAVGILICTEFIKAAKHLDQFIIIGELALDGKVRPISGILSMAEYCLHHHKKLICPSDNYKEAALVKGLEVIPMNTLQDIQSFFCGQKSSEDLQRLANGTPSPTLKNEITSLQKDFVDVKGQSPAKRAMLISAAGRHNLLMVGPPGSGKSMLAERYPSILPNLSPQESLDVTKIHSVAGLLPSDHPLINTRPFRAPHHSISEPALIGGGSDAKPGEISLAHHGVLFLDELPEFKRSTLEVLRQPLESSTISIGRSKRHCEYPANFTLVAAMNPCPCGYQGSRVKNCRCTSHQSERYLSKLSGPLLDRIDIHIEVSDQAPSKLRQSAPSTQSSEELKHQVQEAHRIQKSRYKNETISYNGDLRGGLVDKFCSIHDDAEKALIQGMENMGLSTRAFHKVLIVSRTIADLSASEDIHLDHICEALNYRVLDQKLFN